VPYEKKKEKKNEIEIERRLQMSWPLLCSAVETTGMAREKEDVWKEDYFLVALYAAESSGHPKLLLVKTQQFRCVEQLKNSINKI